MAHGQFLTPIVKRYLDGLESTGRSDNTIISYGRILGMLAEFIHEVPGLTGASDIRGYMVEDFVNSLNGISDATRNYYVTIIKLFFAYMLRAGFIDRDPSDVLQKTKIVTDDEETIDGLDNAAYTDRELLRLMRECVGRNAVRDRAIIALLSGSGLRASELCDITVGAWRGMQKSHVYVKRKGGAHKWVTIAAFAVSYVNAYLMEREIDPHLGDDAPLFITERGRRMTRQSLYKILADRQRSANVRTGIHIFRHTFLTGAKKASDLKTAQLLANHRSSKTTEGYVHTSADERKQAVEGTSLAAAMRNAMG